MNPRVVVRASLLVVAIGCESAVPGDLPEAPIRAPARLGLEPYFRDLRTVRAIVGRDTVALLLDTGGGATLITPTLAAAIGCTPAGRTVGHRMSGEPVEFRYCGAIEMAVGGTPLRLPRIAVFDVNALLPAELPRLGGVLALDAFRGNVLTLDWGGDSIQVHGPAGADAALASSGVPLRPATGADGASLAALLPVAGRRGPLWLLLDSGNLRGTLLDVHVARDSLLAVVDGRATLRVGDRPPWDAPVSVTPLILDGALGTDFLLRGPVTLDLRVVGGGGGR